MILYIRQLISFTVMLTLCQASFTQSNEPTAIATGKGIWVYLGNEIPSDFQYRILKSVEDGDFVPVGTSAYSGDPAALKAKTEEYYPLFDNLDKPVDDELSYLRRYASASSTTDSASLTNFPLMHLLLGTAFFDGEVIAGKTYRYRVVKMSGRDRLWEKTSNSVVFSSETDIPKPRFSSRQEFPSQVVVRWFIPEESSLSTFVVYRRVFGKGDYERINTGKGFSLSQDTVYLIASDTAVQNPAIYEYFIRPLDIYGNSGPESDVVVAGTLGSAGYPVPVYFRARGGVKDHRIELSWKFNEAGYMRSIELYRGKSFDGGFTRIARLSPADTSFADIVPVANENYWYYLIINGISSNSPPTAKVSAMFSNSMEKPLPPSEIGAERITGGIRVHWTYQEPYARGFYVYRYLYETSGFEQVSGLIPADAEVYSYTDTSQYLEGNEVYRYAVRAVNDVDQISDFSETASASPGKKATVGSPMNLRITKTVNGILLVWDDLKPAEPALLGYKVYRKEGPEGDYIILPGDTLRSERNWYRDTTLVAGKRYNYTVSAIDFYGNESTASVSVSFVPEAKNIIPPEIIRVVSTEEGILIGWGQVSDEKALTLKVYRSRPGLEPIPLASMQKTSDEYLDKSVTPGELYTYEISVIYEGGRESERSRGVTVRR